MSGWEELRRLKVDYDIIAVWVQNEEWYGNKQTCYSKGQPGFGRLGHSGPERNPNGCPDLGEIVTCKYIFGDTVLITTHPAGQCPWKQ
jgi:hypothetical protein